MIDWEREMIVCSGLLDDFSNQLANKLKPFNLGEQIAKADSEEQALFFDGLATGFDSFSEGDHDGMQMLHTKKRLSQRAKDFIKKLNEYVNADAPAT